MTVGGAGAFVFPGTHQPMARSTPAHIHGRRDIHHHNQQQRDHALPIGPLDEKCCVGEPLPLISLHNCTENQFSLIREVEPSRCTTALTSGHALTLNLAISGSVGHH